MFRKLLTSTTIACSLALGFATGTFAQTTAEQDAKKAKHEAKEAAESTGEAVKDAGKATGKAAKKVGKTTADVAVIAKETAHGNTPTKSGKLRRGSTSATCADGKVHTGKTKTTACADHGGIKK